ncbi:hypothetical protein ScPMuIL_004870 [Solemya velum]
MTPKLTHGLILRTRILQWKSGESATMRIVVVHAMVILLTYGAPQGDSQYQEVLNTWFPPDGASPSAFLLDTSEEALFFLIGLNFA